MNDKVSITLTISDILKSRVFKLNLHTAWLSSNSRLSRNSQIVYLGATYRFGNAYKRYVRDNLDYEQ